ncbi:MAG: alpha/beta hydrolase [Candidatus Taylorbacteria bacterium]|nr:alpha/beta hydrolase [Candidatus Taylorbacteria bacterium]
MKRIMIVHQWMVGVEGDWRPWLKKELEKRGYEVSMPEMPDIDTPIIEKWVGKLAEVVGMPDKDTYFIGHSIGCQAIIRYLETIDTPVGGAIFVAGWFDLKNLESSEVEEIAMPWIEMPIDIEKVKAVLPKSILIISDNDPYDCFEENKAGFEKLGSKLMVVPKAGHFTAEEGFSELPVVVKEIERY